MRLVAVLLAIAGFALGAEVTRKSSVPMVAFHCGYRNQFVNESGFWTTDNSTYSRCVHKANDILRYCQKVYPSGNVVNVLQYDQTVPIGNWLNITSNAFNEEKFVTKAYLCLAGGFRENVVHVPKNCKAFDFVSTVLCKDSDHWLNHAQLQCQKRFGEVYSHKNKNPCEDHNFRGTSYVCCAKGAHGLRSDQDLQDDAPPMPTPATLQAEEDFAKVTNAVTEFIGEYWKFMLLVFVVVVGVALGYLALRCERRDGFEPVAKEAGGSREDLFEYKNDAYSTSNDRKNKPQRPTHPAEV